jgi:hypothetical protein
MARAVPVLGTDTGTTDCQLVFGANRMEKNRTDNRTPIVETPMQARQAEPGPSVLKMLIASLGLVTFVMALIWIIFFRT